MLSTGFARVSKRGQALLRRAQPTWAGSSFVPLLAALLIGLPPLGPWLKSSMLTHMLIQIPAFVVCGHAAGRRLRRRHPQLALRSHLYRWPLLLCAAFTLMAWMLPRLLDLAVESPAVDGAKLLSLTLLAGMPLGLAWSCFGPVVRALVHVEALATLWRLGWLYIDSPARLCTQYGLDDQNRLGLWMLGLGAVYALWLAVKALSGSATPPVQRTI